MSNDIKKLRGQVRQIVKELLPQIMTEELISAIKKDLAEQVKARLDFVEEKQKHLQSYIIRQNFKLDSIKEPKK